MPFAFFWSCQTTQIETSESTKTAPQSTSELEPDIQDTSTLPCTSEEDLTPLIPTEHFSLWLADSGYSSDLLRPDLQGGAFGGLVSSDDCLRQNPIVFVHGNSDRATGGIYGGFEEMTNTLREYGYRSSEMYATTYGPADPNESSNYTHSQTNVKHVRHFIEAVLEYTQSEQVNIIAHSLGVTMARKAILGGIAMDDDGSTYELGSSLTSKVRTFVGIAGANQGLANCIGSPFPICSWLNGLQPSSLGSEQSLFLQDINARGHYEGEQVFSIWSYGDEIIQYLCMIGDTNTCQVPYADGEKVYTSFSHFDLKDNTGDTVFAKLQDLYLD